MAELGSGNGSDYPGTLDIDNVKEVDSPNAGKTKARADVPNDLAAAIVAIQTELGTDPAGTLTNVKTFLQTEHGADGTHDATKVGMLAGAQTFTDLKTFSGGVIWSKGADIASAAALTLGSDGNYFDVTGTTGITSIGTKGVGFIVFLHFDDAVLLTHHATDLILPGGVNITTAAGDEFIFVEYATGDWRMVASSIVGSTGYFKAGVVDQTAIGASAVGQGELKTTTAENSTTSTGGASQTLGGGSYSFFPSIKQGNASFQTRLGHTASPYYLSTTASTSYVTVLHLHTTSASGTAYVQNRYIQSSPPYMIGTTQWGHFLFLLRKIGTGEVVSAYQAEDPPWAYNGLLHLPKDHPDKISEVPHPFADYWTKDPTTEGLEVVLVDLKSVDVKKWRNNNAKVGKGLLEDISSVVTGLGIPKAFNAYGIPTIPRFTDKVKVIIP